MINSFLFLNYIVINVFIGGILENQLVEGQPSVKELNMKYEIDAMIQFEDVSCFVSMTRTHDIIFWKLKKSEMTLQNNICQEVHQSSEIFPLIAFTKYLY